MGKRAYKVFLKADNTMMQRDQKPIVVQGTGRDQTIEDNWLRILDGEDEVLLVPAGNVSHVEVADAE